MTDRVVSKNKTSISAILKGKVVIVGLGNSLRGDDGVGSALVKRLRGRIEAVCIDAESTPENYLGRIIREKPDTLLFVDAVDLGTSPGDYELLESSDLTQSVCSTHDISLRMLVELLRREIDCSIYILCIQPENLILGETLSKRAEQTLHVLEGAILHERGKPA
ncbi:MAG TPA: hydrogenase maturation protease [Spirochaetia bacterium]|nr:hydrogenase maturation protease [Spirochaetia bacterium]